MTPFVKALLMLQVLAGLAVAFLLPGIDLTSTTAIWSDFMAFQARVQADETARHILAYGGENPNESFPQLLDRLLRIEPSKLWMIVGLFISANSFLVLILSLRITQSAPHTTNDKV